MSATRDPELAAFKTEIDLRVYAASAGYELDRRESWRGSSVMRHANGDKIIIKRDVDGNYVFFSVRDEADNGSIIDFVQKRGGGNLGKVRSHLRDWLSYGSRRQREAAPLPLFAPLQPTAKDRLEVERQFRLMPFVERHAWLESVRRIPYDVLAADRFAGRIRTDRRGNAVFGHWDEQGLCGYEIKNAGYTGFAKGGEKGLWLSHVNEQDTRLVICEGAIDALLHAALFPSAVTRYASIAGQMQDKQRQLLGVMLAKLPPQCAVVAATDNDQIAAPDKVDSGLLLAQEIERLVLAVPRTDLAFTMHRPQAAKDWNQALQDDHQYLPPYCPT